MRKYRKNDTKLPKQPALLAAIEGFTMPVDSINYSSAAQRRVFSNIVSIAGENPSDNTALTAIFEELRILFPWVAISLSVYDPLKRQHKTALSEGYSEKNIDYLNNAYLNNDPAYRWMKKSGRSFFNWQSTDFDYSKSVSATKFWIPSGFRGGSTNYLTTRDNRYVGNLHVSTDKSKYPTIEDLRFIDDISSLLSAFLDVWREPRALLNSLTTDESAFFLDFKGQAHPIPGNPECEIRDLQKLAGSAVANSGSCAGLGVLNQRLPPSCWYTHGESVRLVSFKICNQGVFVTHKWSAFPNSLTQRQAEVCSLLALGLTSHEVAEALMLSTRTVDSHVEHIFDKIGAKNRIELAYFSITAGLINLSDYVRYSQSN